MDMKNVKRRNGLKKLLVLAMVATVLVMGITPVFAASVQEYIDGTASWSAVSDGEISTYISTNKSDWDWKSGLPKSTISNANGGTADPANAKVNVTCKGETIGLTEAGYKQLNSLVKQEADAAKAKSKVNAIGNGLDFNPDIGGATDMLQGFMKPLSLIVGVICVVAMTAVTVFTASDILYMTIPILREKCDAATANHSGLGKESSGGGTRPRWVTDEAYASVQEATTSGKNMFTVYIKKRGAAVIFQAVAIYILLTGNITMLSNVLINIIGSIMGALSSLAG